MFKPDKQKQLAQALSAGVDIETAAHYAGLSVNEVYRALERGKIESDKVSEGGRAVAAETPYRKFFEDMRSARAKTVVRNSTLVQTAANDDWRAAAWWLERAGGQQFVKPDARRSEIEAKRQIEK